MVLPPTSEVTYSNLLSVVESFLKSRERSYITKPGAEERALNQFMLANIPAIKVIELIEKLIDIRRHPKLKLESFWISATENVSGAYSYMQKIETVHASIWPEAQKRKEEQNLKDPKLGWKGFLEFSKQMPGSIRDEISNLLITENFGKSSITISKCSNKLCFYIQSFFSHSGWKIIMEESNANNL